MRAYIAQKFLSHIVSTNSNGCPGRLRKHLKGVPRLIGRWLPTRSFTEANLIAIIADLDHEFPTTCAAASEEF